MRKVRNLTLLAALSLAAVLARADEWAKTYDLTGKPDLRVSASDASIRIESWDQNKIEARLSTRGWHIGGGELEVVERQNGNAVEIEIREHNHAHFHFGVSIDSRHADLEIHMPRSAKVNIHTGDGAILARELEGQLEFTTSDGRLDLEGVQGTLRARTSDGSVHVAGRLDEVDVQTSDGRIEFDAQQGSQVRGPWDLRTADGSITMRVPANLAADVDLHTGDGSITTEIPLVVQGSFSKQDLRGKMNGGGNRLSVRTGDGSITVDKL